MAPEPVSVITPVGRALGRVGEVLFRPFSASKWFTIGFCAWLSYLGTGGGGRLNFNLPGRNHAGADQARAQLWRARDYALDHLYWIVPLGVALILFGLVVWVFFTWLNSRGAFMFLHCVARNRAEVAEPWRQYGHEANSLFAFRIGLGLVAMAVTLPPLLFCVGRCLGMFMDDAWTGAGIREAILLGLAWLAGALVFGIVRLLTNDFVVPLMLLRRTGWSAGWAECGRLLAANPGRFVLYLLFQVVLAVAIAVLIVATVIATCCIAGCLLVLPYLGTVLLLPVLVFARAYSLHYLAQYGPEFDVFAPTAPASMAPPPL